MTCNEISNQLKGLSQHLGPALQDSQDRLRARRSRGRPGAIGPETGLEGVEAFYSKGLPRPRTETPFPQGRSRPRRKGTRDFGSWTPSNRPEHPNPIPDTKAPADTGGGRGSDALRPGRKPAGGRTPRRSGPMRLAVDLRDVRNVRRVSLP